ncbi:MAG: sugar ABC transporter ATP-binding protein [Stappiaceae bacterium]
MHIIDINNASKSYGAARALENVDLSLKGGSVHALMGENGAGKSTLIKLLSGIVSADELSLAINDTQVPLRNTDDARQAGFQFIHQELDIVPHLSVAENIYLSAPYPRRLGGLIDWRTLKQRAREALLRLGVDHIDLRVQAARLSTGDQMLMRIASSLLRSETETESLLYVFDEPTAALSDEEAEKLFSVISSLKSHGAAVLYVSHRMNEVMRICDEVTVLRDGRKVLTSPISEIDSDGLILAMTGRDLTSTHPARNSRPSENVICDVKGLTTRHVRKISFDLHKGEILGISGVANSGQSELLQALFGLEPHTGGSILINGKPAPQSAHEAWGRGIGYVPRERRSEALMLKQPILRNVVLSQIGLYASALGVMRAKAERAHCSELVKKVGLKFQSLEQPVYQLSGGNQQKVVFARAISITPKLLFLDEPTRGVDVGAKYEIYALLRQLTETGCSIIMNSTDLPELVGMCDRILIMHEGRQSEIVDAEGLETADLLARFYLSPSEEKLAS